MKKNYDKIIIDNKINYDNIVNEIYNVFNMNLYNYGTEEEKLRVLFFKLGSVEEIMKERGIVMRDSAPKVGR